MSSKVGTVIGKLSLIAGARQERAENMAAVKPARGILRKGKPERLHTILEVTGDPSGRERIYRELIRIIGEEYFQARGSVTARLRQAIGAANSFLLHENLKSIPHEHRAGGVTCAVLREGNVYIAQAGPTAAHVSYQGKLTSFPRSPVTDFTAEEATPLGFKRGMPIRFYRSEVGVGDVILLASGCLSQQASPEQIAQAVVGKDMGPALANLEELTGEGDASAMLIRIAPVEERPRVKRQVAVRRSVRPKVKETPEEQLTTPRDREAPQERPPRSTGDSLEHRVSSLLENALKGTGDFLRRLLPERVLSDSTKLTKVPAKAKEAPAPNERVAQPRRPHRTAKGRKKLAEGRRNLWMGLAIAIPVIVFILVIVVYWQQGLIRQARFDELVAQAQQQMELVGQLDEDGRPRHDEAAARGHLLEALASLAEAAGLEPGNPQVSDLREQAEYTLDKVDRVTRLNWIVPLWEYEESGSDPGRVIVVNGIDVYVLDKALHRVYKHLLDDTMQALQELQGPEADPVLMRKGDQRDSIVVGELVDMVWAEAEGGRLDNNLLVLESGGSLLEYDPLKGISVLPVGGSDRWIQPQIVGSYDGNIYLLDSSLNQILRYEPDYGGSPVDYFSPSGGVNLAGVVDMALDDQIYILYADGRILKFLDDQPIPFEIPGLYEPLQNPTALFTSEESEFLYVADAGNKRIVQLTKEGRFLQQFKAGQGEAFDQLKGLFALEKYNLLYFISGNKLYVTNIPSE